jgi:hypothetical protein
VLFAYLKVCMDYVDRALRWRLSAQTKALAMLSTNDDLPNGLLHMCVVCSLTLFCVVVDDNVDKLAHIVKEIEMKCDVSETRATTVVVFCKNLNKFQELLMACFTTNQTDTTPPSSSNEQQDEDTTTTTTTSSSSSSSSTSKHQRLVLTSSRARVDDDGANRREKRFKIYICF